MKKVIGFLALLLLYNINIVAQSKSTRMDSNLSSKSSFSKGDSTAITKPVEKKLRISYLWGLFGEKPETNVDFQSISVVTKSATDSDFSSDTSRTNRRWLWGAIKWSGSDESDTLKSSDGNKKN